MPFVEKTPALHHAAMFKDYHRYVRGLLREFECNKVKEFAEIGGSIGNNAAGLFPDANYYNLDITENDKVRTIVQDVTKPLPKSLINKFDFIYTNDAFEHIDKPWLAAQNIELMLKPGGMVFVGTLFSWRYHPVPIDYWRFSPAGLVALFENLECCEANFNSYWRRHNFKGHWPSKKDNVPEDMIGGFRENWKVYYLGRKAK